MIGATNMPRMAYKKNIVVFYLSFYFIYYTYFL